MSKIITIECKKRERKQWKKLQICHQLDHISMVNQLYLDHSFEGKEKVQKELSQKRHSYKNQDRRKKKYTNDFITEEELLEKLVISKLRCKYCRDKLQFIYKHIREEKQWTLDRIDNTLGHSAKNTVIACLQCNLKRRNINDKKFLFTKQMRLIKKY